MHLSELAAAHAGQARGHHGRRQRHGDVRRAGPAQLPGVPAAGRARRGSGRSRRGAHGQPARVLRDRLGRAAPRRLLDAGQLAPDRRRGQLYRRGLRRAVLFASPETADVAAQIAAAAARPHRVRRRGRPPGPAALRGRHRRAVRASRRTRSRAMYFFYSSGTTGRPKGILPDHARSRRSAPARARAADAGGVRLRRGHRLPVPGAALPRGAARLVDGHASARRHGRADGAVRPGRVPAGDRAATRSPPPSSCRRISSGCSSCRRTQRAGFDTSSLQTVVHAAAPCPVEVKQQMIDWLGPIIIRVLRRQRGQRVDDDQLGGLAGPPRLGRPSAWSALHIWATTAASCRPARTASSTSSGGAVRVPQRPGQDRERRNDNGWTTLGDIGHLDDEGYLYLTDRRTDLIISGGVNIYPAEIEEALIMHPAVADVAVIGVPDAEMGQSVLAIVQPAVQGTWPDRAGGRAHRALPVEAGLLQVPRVGGVRRRAAANADREAPAPRLAGGTPAYLS